MTTLHRPVRRVSNSTLSHAHGRDKNRRIIVTLMPGNGDSVPDLIHLKLSRLSKTRAIALEDLWVYLIKCEVNQKKMAKLREKNAKKEEQQRKRRWKASLKSDT